MYFIEIIPKTRLTNNAERKIEINIMPDGRIDMNGIRLRMWLKKSKNIK
jgi:hypothetical protein